MRAARRSHAALALALACAACSPIRLVESARLGVAAGAGADATAQHDRRDVVLAGQTGDLYLPPEPRAALLMVPGVTPLGRDDPRLIAFAGVLARHGFLVFVPELPGLRAQRVASDDPARIAAAGDALASCFPPQVPPRLAVAAISYAVAPAILAALREPGGERVALILGIGGYHDLVAAITFLPTGHYRETASGPWRRGEPRPIARWVFVQASALQAPDPRDRALLTAIAEAKLADPEADVAGLAEGLGPGGRSMLALALNTDPDRVAELMSALPGSLRADLARVDLKRYPLDGLRADLVLIHGRDDPLIPATESQALAAAAAPGRAHLFVVGNLGHVEIGPGGLADTLRLWQAAYRLLTLRDDLTPPDPGRCALATSRGSGSPRRSGRRRPGHGAGRSAAPARRASHNGR